MRTNRASRRCRSQVRKPLINIASDDNFRKALESTCRLLLDSVAPLAKTPEQMAQTRSVVQSFQTTEGPRLQDALMAHAEGKKNWLADWWTDHAYMTFRGPTVVWVSFFYGMLGISVIHGWSLYIISQVFKDDLALRNAPARRSAELVRAAFQFREQIVNQTLVPDKAKTGNLCMDQFHVFLSCPILITLISSISSTRPVSPHLVRIFQHVLKHRFQGKDKTRVSPMSENSYIIAIRDNRFYKINVAGPGGAYLSTVDLEQQFRCVYLASDSPGTPPAPAIGLLTTENRDTWAKAREELCKSRVNEATLDEIEV